MYRQIHELPYQSGVKERFFSLGPFSFSLGESGWVALGLYLSYQLTKNVGPLPLPIPASHLHYAIPLLATYFFSKARHPATGIPLWEYFGRWVAVRRRKRAFYYRKSNIVEGGDRYI
jgi:hypothetical protein